MISGDVSSKVLYEKIKFRQTEGDGRQHWSNQGCHGYLHMRVLLELRMLDCLFTARSDVCLASLYSYLNLDNK